jgi:malonyl-CoA O-methyltransferase
MKKRDNFRSMDSHDIRRRFDRAAATFDSAAFVHTATRDGLLERLEPMTLSADMIVDLGAATGAGSRPLARKFRGASVLSVDLSLRMLEKASRRSSWFSRRPAAQADARRLPLADHSVDVVFSNLLLPWVADRAGVFSEISRVLRQDGLFLFSTLGPDSLAGLMHEPFPDMHSIGDELVRAGLRDPVLDVDRLTVTYENRESLLRDLASLGCAGCLPAGVHLPRVELELIYGHCWGPGERFAAGEVKVDVGHIARRKR